MPVVQTHTPDRPLRTPRSWIERHVERKLPHASLSEIKSIHRKLDAITNSNGFRTSTPLILSYVPNTFSKFASDLGTDDSNLLLSLETDFRSGVVVQHTSWKTGNGQTKVRLLGTRWHVILRPQTGKKSGNPLAVIDSVRPQDIPTGQVKIIPDTVSIMPIWDEQRCDLGSLESRYSEGKRKVDEARDAKRNLSRRLDRIHDERAKVFPEVARLLGRGRQDTAIEERSALHSMVRRQYSALRVMMNLIRFKSEREVHNFTGSVVVRDEPTEASESEHKHSRGQAEDKNDASLRVLLSASPDRDALDEGTRVEIGPPTSQQTKRTKVLDITRQGRRTTLTLDLPPDSFTPGSEVQIRTVPQFGLRAHERAIKSLLNDEIEGHWPDLVRLLCAPEKLDAPVAAEPPEYFFCDRDEQSHPLNEQQRRAVTGAITTPHTFCIQGPPGTGKTTVICELVQQLAARGERVLLAASSHVAVDEVLRRIGSKPGVRALRLSWDEKKVGPDVRKYMPSHIIEPFVEKARGKGTHVARHWQLEQEKINEALELLTGLQTWRTMLGELDGLLNTATAHASDTGHVLAGKGPELRRTISDLTNSIDTTERSIKQARSNLTSATDTHHHTQSNATTRAKLAGIFGLGEVGKARRLKSRFKSLLKSGQRRLKSLTKQINARTTFLDGLTRNDQEAKSAVDHLRERVANTSAKEAEVIGLCKDHALLKSSELDDDAVRLRQSELRDRHERLAGYEALAGQFDQILKDIDGGQDREGLLRDLLAISNLFCCTTTGIAGSKILSDVVFDTLIIDEASRVTDSEFLIGAVRAKRWILVGDERQLPPYVEQRDEHFIHALSSLHRMSEGSTVIDQAVDELGQLWEEDEEIHRFRRDSVLRIAQGYLDGNDWDHHYRKAFEAGISYLKKEVSNPSSELLRAMRHTMVHSLFERVVTKCPPQLRVRLIEQRRMIEPIADIVSQPIYGGEYRSPPPDELARSGVTPLTTPTFPTPITFLDTSLLGTRARDELLGSSFVNRTEARWIVDACKILNNELGQAGALPVTVSVLTFYKAQARLIRDRLGVDGRLNQRQLPHLRFSVIDSIDRIQGQESDIVFLSFCRTAGKRVSPFFGQWLQDVRRLNVACTRAHRALIFVGQRELLGRLCSNEDAVAFYQHLNQLFENNPHAMRVVRQFGTGKD